MAREQPNLERLGSINVDGSRRHPQPADVKGRFVRARSLVYAFLIIVYVALPFVKIGGYPAMQLDVAARRFYLFGSVFNAQDFWRVAFLVVIAAVGLLFVTAWVGRVWCGWACPQTVFLEGVYRRVERWIDGPREKRIRMMYGPWTFEKVVRRVAKHAIFLLISAFLAHVAMSFFVTPKGAFSMVLSGPGAHWTAFVWVTAVTLALYFNFAWFREQLCIVICPYGRMQSVLLDSNSLIIGYDKARGEPRGKIRRNRRRAPARAKTELVQLGVQSGSSASTSSAPISSVLTESVSTPSASIPPASTPSASAPPASAPSASTPSTSNQSASTRFESSATKPPRGATSPDSKPASFKPAPKPEAILGSSAERTLLESSAGNSSTSAVATRASSPPTSAQRPSTAHQESISPAPSAPSEGSKEAARRVPTYETASASSAPESGALKKPAQSTSAALSSKEASSSLAELAFAAVEEADKATVSASGTSSNAAEGASSNGEIPSGAASLASSASPPAVNGQLATSDASCASASSAPLAARAAARDEQAKLPPLGDCIDCNRCVVVCPTGIDIRNGTQMECIACAQCIDACDEVMRKVGRPTGLIRYDSQQGLEGKPTQRFTPRLVTYAAILVVATSLFLITSLGRQPFEANPLRVRGAPYVLENGGIRNQFELHLVNKNPGSSTLSVEVKAPVPINVIVPHRSVTLDSLEHFRLPVFIQVKQEDWNGPFELHFHIEDSASKSSREVKSPFLGPSVPLAGLQMPQK